jgi:hypothetical protein
VRALAAIARPKRLVLTHFYSPVEAEDIAGQVAEQFDGTVCVRMMVGHSSSRKESRNACRYAPRRAPSEWKQSARPFATWATRRAHAGEQRTAVGTHRQRRTGGRLERRRPAGVAQVLHVSKPYKQVSREWKSETTLVNLGRGVVVGGSDVVVIAGPCSVESEEQIIASARAVKAAGATALRGGAFKPRTSPYSFQGSARRGSSCSHSPGRKAASPS